MRLPSTNPVTLAYGATSPPYTTSAPHAGTDYAGPDLNSYAPEDVKIVDYFPYDGVNPCGNQLDMVSLDGKRRYRFCHSSAVLCTVGQTYKEGTVLAKEGAVGLAFGVHLHIVMWVNGVRVDPDKTIKSMIGGSMNLSRHDAGREVLCHWGRPATEVELAKYTKVEEGLMRKRICDDPQTDQWIAKLALLKAEATPLPPGKYQVK